MPNTTCDYVQLSFSFIAWHSPIVQESRQNLTASAISFVLFGVIGGLGLDLCAKGLLATCSLDGDRVIRADAWQARRMASLGCLLCTGK